MYCDKNRKQIQYARLNSPDFQHMCKWNLSLSKIKNSMWNIILAYTWMTKALLLNSWMPLIYYTQKIIIETIYKIRE